MEYRTVTGVEIATVGMDWPTSAGEGTFTFENLSDAVEAANNDPHIRTPRGKLGHLSEVNGELRTVSPFEAIGDAEPAFGRYVNLSLTNDGAALIGDWIEVPVWLADAAPSAFPSRSLEAVRDVTTVGGKKYSMVITAVSCLGTRLPAVTDLDDLERFMVEGPDLSTTAATQGPEEGRMPETTTASIDAGTIRQRFNFEWTLENDFEYDTYWWWCRSVRVDPLEIIADDDDGGLWLISVETDGKDEVTFGEPQKVREEFVPVAATATSVVANFRDRKDQQVLASNLERPEKPAPKTAASSQPEPQEDDMSIDLDKLRGRLGLPDDATEEQINEALAKEPESPAEPAEPVTPTDEIPAEPVAETTPAEPEPVAASAELPEGMVAVPKDQWERVQAGAVAGGELASKTETKRRDDTIAAAVKDGKVPPSERQALCNMHGNEATRSAFYTLLTAAVKDGGLAKDLVPVTERGEAGGDEVAASAGLPGNWFPELNKGGAATKED
jgi:hypothetical protein